MRNIRSLKSAKPILKFGVAQFALISDLVIGLITSVMPMYLTELAPSLLRGSMGVLCPLGVTFGVLAGQVMSLSNILGNEQYWPHLLAIYLLPQALCSVILIFLPESPKYLFVVKKQPHLALKRELKILVLEEKIHEIFQN